MNRRSPLTAFAALCVFVFLYAPLAVVILYSFNAARYGVEWQGFTVDWYLKLIDNDPAIAADWGVTDPILSARDQANPRRDDIEPRLRPAWAMRT